MNTIELDGLKKRIADAVAFKNRSEGTLEELTASLKRDYGLGSFAEAIDYTTKQKVEISALQQAFDEGVAELKGKMV